jgi:hypothetical protein
MKEKNKLNGCLAIIGVLILVYVGLLILSALTDFLDAIFSIPYINLIVVIIILIVGYLSSRK